MKDFGRGNKILTIILVLSVFVSIISVGGRAAVEKENKNYDIVLDYNEVAAMAAQSDHDLSWWLAEFKAMGINKVGVTEESITTLMDSSDYLVSGEMMDVIQRDADWESDYPDELVRQIKEFGYNRYDLLIRTTSMEMFSFLSEAINERYTSHRHLAYSDGRQGFILLEGTPKDTLFTGKYNYLNTLNKPFGQKNDIVSSKLMYINFGLLPAKVDLVRNAGLEIVPRTASYEGWNDTAYAEAVVASYEAVGGAPTYMIVGGESVIGFDDGINFARNYITEKNVTIGLIEDTTQLQNLLQYGVEDIIQSTGHRAVRVFSVWDYIQNRYQYYNYTGAKEIENTLFRAVVERNVRLIYFKPIRENKDQYVYVTDVKEYRTMFANLEERLEGHNLTPGQASVMDNYQVRRLAKAAMGMGSVAAAILLLSALFRTNRKMEYLLFGIGALGVLGIFALKPAYGELIASFTAAVLFPCLGILFLTRRSKENQLRWGSFPGVREVIVQGSFCLLIAVAISLFGAMMTTAPISSANYMLEIDIFRGVKIAQLLPFVFFAVVYLAEYGSQGNKVDGGKLELKDVTGILNLNIRLWMLILVGALGGVGYYYLMRTGHDSGVEVSNLEMIFRNALEDSLLARPRNKEFLFAFPSVLLMMYTAARKWPVLTAIFGLTSVIGLTSVVNTFMHIRTPLYLGLVRTGFSLGFGILVGIVAVMVFHGICTACEKLGRQKKDNV